MDKEVEPVCGYDQYDVINYEQLSNSIVALLNEFNSLVKENPIEEKSFYTWCIRLRSLRDDIDSDLRSAKRWPKPK